MKKKLFTSIVLFFSTLLATVAEVYADSGMGVTSHPVSKSILTAVIILLLVFLVVLTVMAVSRQLKECSFIRILLFTLAAFVSGLLCSFAGMIITFTGSVFFNTNSGDSYPFVPLFIIFALVSAILAFLLDRFLSSKILKRGSLLNNILGIILALLTNAGAILAVFEFVNRTLK